MHDNITKNTLFLLTLGDRGRPISGEIREPRTRWFLARARTRGAISTIVIRSRRETFARAREGAPQ
jgi:hypothetical protein